MAAINAGRIVAPNDVKKVAYIDIYLQQIEKN